jgi:AcrR family transcriptional regulator
MKPGNKKNAEIQMIPTTGNVQNRIHSPSVRLIVLNPHSGPVADRQLRTVADRQPQGQSSATLDVVSAQTRRFSEITRTAAQTRVLDAALKLIAERGVSGTSLQMIADELGVTKAAVYRQFKTKEEIVVAITERELGQLEDALEAAEAEENRLRAREVLLERMIDQAIERRGTVSVLQFDPAIIRLQAEYEPFERFIERLYAALLGTEAGPQARLHAALLTSAISVAVMHPLIADVDDDELREQLQVMTRRMFGLPAQGSTGTAISRSAAV